MARSHLTHAQYVDASPNVVWQHAADFGNVAAWTPELSRSQLLGDEVVPGVQRNCTLARPWLGQSEVHERLLMLEPPVIQYEVTRPFAMFAHAKNTWTLTPEGDGTMVLIHARFVLRWGVLGRELWWLARPKIRRTVKRALRQFAAHVEAA